MKLPDPDDALDRLADCRAPTLIGVRHHSAALARVMPDLLDDIAPQTILLEMPPDFAEWLPFLGRDDLRAPVALAACGQAHLLSFYPMADFSPELAAIRWAAQHDVPVVPCDLDLVAMQVVEDSDQPLLPFHDAESPDPQLLWHDRFMRELLERTQSRDSGELWENLVETPACQSSPEMIRRAALLFGWAIRQASGGPHGK